jgi:predicted signal transduction protein with EAL and GGDEF domain
VASKAIDALKHPLVIDGREVFVSAGIGIALFPQDGGSAEELLRQADIGDSSACRSAWCNVWRS